MKTVFIIAGFDIHTTAAEPDFKPLREGLKTKGYNVVPSPISWRQKTPSQYAEEFISFYNKYRTEDNTIVGNSFGAVVALMAGAIVQPNQLYLCSLSAFFKEDRGTRSDEFGYKHFGKRRMHDLWSVSFDELAERINKGNTKVIVAYGDKEPVSSPPLVKRCKLAAKKLDGAELKILKNTPHSMRNKNYTAELLKIF